MTAKTVIITGGASGIGRACALRFAATDARVIALDINPEVLALGDDVPNICGLRCDLADPDQVSSSLGRALRAGHVDVLVNSAGINPQPSDLADTDEAIWQGLLDNNLTSVFHVTKAVLSRMHEGAIINISSILGIGGARRNAAYAATKGAIIALTRAMARDHGPAVRVNCVCPGAVETAMFEHYLGRCADPEVERARIRASLPLRRLGRPEDIANAVFFLASDSASWMTGQTLIVDGGDTA